MEITPDGTWEHEGKKYKPLKCPFCGTILKPGLCKITLVHEQIKHRHPDYKKDFSIKHIAEIECFICGQSWKQSQQFWSHKDWNKLGIEIENTSNSK